MQVIRDLSEAKQIRHPQIRELVQQRIHALGADDFNSGDIGYFLVVQVGDNLQDLETQLRFNLLANRYSGVRYDQPGFTPSWEILESFTECFELVFVLSDDGHGVDVFIERDTAIDPDLQEMCAMFAVGAPSAISGSN